MFIRDIPGILELWFVSNKTLDKIEAATNQKPKNNKYYENVEILLINASPQCIQKLNEESNISTIALAAEDDFHMVD